MLHYIVDINARHACAVRVTLIGPCVCVCVYVISFLPPRASRPRIIGRYGFITTMKKLLES